MFSCISWIFNWPLIQWINSCCWSILTHPTMRLNRYYLTKGWTHIKETWQMRWCDILMTSFKSLFCVLHAYKCGEKNSDIVTHTFFSKQPYSVSLNMGACPKCFGSWLLVYWKRLRKAKHCHFRGKSWIFFLCHTVTHLIDFRRSPRGQYA